MSLSKDFFIEIRESSLTSLTKNANYFENMFLRSFTIIEQKNLTELLEEKQQKYLTKR